MSHQQDDAHARVPRGITEPAPRPEGEESRFERRVRRILESAPKRPFGGPAGD